MKWNLPATTKISVPFGSVIGRFCANMYKGYRDDCRSDAVFCLLSYVRYLLKQKPHSRMVLKFQTRMTTATYGKPWAANKVCGHISNGLEMKLFLKVIIWVTLKLCFPLCVLRTLLVYKTKAVSNRPNLEEHRPSQKASFCPFFLMQPDVTYYDMLRRSLLRVSVYFFFLHSSTYYCNCNQHLLSVRLLFERWKKRRPLMRIHNYNFSEYCWTQYLTSLDARLAKLWSNHLLHIFWNAFNPLKTKRICFI
jgi:hypothetical protein